MISLDEFDREVCYLGSLRLTLPEIASSWGSDEMDTALLAFQLTKAPQRSLLQMDPLQRRWPRAIRSLTQGWNKSR